MNYSYPIPGSQAQPEIFTSDISGRLGSYDKPVDAIIQLEIDYSLLPAPPAIDSFSFRITPGGLPNLLIGAPVVDDTSGHDALRFVIQGGIAGRTYTVTIDVIGPSGGVRSDVLIVNVLGDDSQSCQIIQPVINDGLTSPDGSLYVNTAPRMFVSSTPPNGARVMDYWYNTTTGEISINISDGDTTTWVLVSAIGTSVVSETPRTLYYRANSGQTVFPLSVIDLYGNNAVLNGLQIVVVTKGGLRLAPDSGYTVDLSSSTISLLWPAGDDEILTIDIYDALVGGSSPTGPNWWLLLPKTLPSIAGVLWNNGGVICVS